MARIVGVDLPKNKRGEIGCILSTLPYAISETGYGYMEGTSMACPHVSGVAALGLSYAAKLRRHFTADEFKALLYETTTPIDDYMSGMKLYYRYVADVGLNQPMQLNKSNYRGQMGVGQVNAAKLLNAVAVSPEEVELTRATEIRLNNEYYTLQKDGDKISYALKEA